MRVTLKDVLHPTCSPAAQSGDPPLCGPCTMSMYGCNGRVTVVVAKYGCNGRVTVVANVHGCNGRVTDLATGSSDRFRFLAFLEEGAPEAASPPTPAILGRGMT